MKKASQGNLVFTELRRQILIMHLQSGSRLKEDFWAKKLGVSRMAVREALTRLLGEGLVYLGPKGGYYVMELTPEDVLQLRQVREIIEIAALELAMNRINGSDIKKLEKICDDFSIMVEKGYISGACEADIKFHETLVELSGNKKLLLAYHSCHIPLFHQKIGKTKAFTNDYDITDKEHRALLKFIKQKDLNNAKQTLIKHFSRGEKAILEL
ncbi:MAG: GntR family transcriptional regulator [Bacteroidota bacterium]